ncbi:MAG: S8 family serine peptidase [Faecousia sp.]
MKLRNRVLSFLLALCMLLTLAPVSAMAAEKRTEAVTSPILGEDQVSPSDLPVELLPQDNPETDIGVTAKEIENPGVDLKQNQAQTPLETARPADDENVRVIVVLEEKGLLEKGYTTAQIASNGATVIQDVKTMARQQATVLSAMEKVADVEVRYQYNVVFNGMAVEIPYGSLETIKAIPGVEDAFLAPRYDVPEDMGTTGSPVADPAMYNTKDTFGSALTWESLGYTGQGMRVAVIDTGLDMDHPSFTDAPVLTEDSLTKEEVDSVLTTLNAYQRYSQTSAVKLSADKLYRSEKVPYAFNYVDNGLDVTHDHDNAGDHGTHVAGIATANALDTTDVVGVAPDAQLLVMKVFGVNGGAYFDDILAALEDCYRLNVDAVNLSLGSPAGFSDESEKANAIYGQVRNSDMVIAVAAGNSRSAAYMNGYGTNTNLTCDPDNGIVSSPATYPGATGVASVENTMLMLNYMMVGGEKICFSDAAIHPFTDLAGKELEYVMVPGYGTKEDFAQVNVLGRVAVVSRGSANPAVPVTFVDKQTNAYNGGAIACVVYDNVDGSIVNMIDAGLLPNVFVTKASGEILAKNTVNGVGTLEVMPLDEMTQAPNPEGGLMSSFSSWGVTPDLEINPDVTAPGGNIYSCYTDGQYGTMSGTSMASPHIAGMSALVLQYLRDEYDLTDAQTHTIAEALIMSTASPIAEPSGILYSPRSQGAGVANVYNAITSPAYLTADNGEEKTPKISFGDDDARTGVYRFSFDVNNLTDKPLSYTLDGIALTDQVDTTYESVGYLFMSEASRELEATVTFAAANGQLPLQYDYNGDGATDFTDVQAFLDAVNGLSQVKAGYDLNGDGVTDTADVQKLYELVSQGFTAMNVVEVPADGSATIYVTLTLSENDKAYMDKYYENGIYVDGFIRLYGANGENDLSLPFVGFYGDWSAARVFDSGWYYEGRGGQDAEFNRYMNVLFTDFGPDPYSASNLGINPYTYEPYDPSHNVLSPNGDGYVDKISNIYLSLMRNAELIDYTWTDEDGNELFYEWYPYARKSYYNNYYGKCLPAIYTDACVPFDFKNEDGSYMVKNGDKVRLTIDAFLDDGELDDGYANEADLDERVVFDITIDTEKPVLDTSRIAYLYNPYTDGRRLEFYVSDNHGIAAVVPMTEAGTPYEYIKVNAGPGEEQFISLDVSEYDATFRIAVCDYGCNESYYEISFAGETNISFDSFYGYRRFSSPIIGGYLFSTDQLNGWYSFESADDMLRHTSLYGSGRANVAAAEYIDGYIIGVDTNSEIFTMKAGSWDRTKLGDLKVGQYWWAQKTYPALDMAFDYTTNTLYVLADELNENEGSRLMTIDYLTGAITDLGVIGGIDHEKTQLFTLACDNDGQLYSVDISEGRLHKVNRNEDGTFTAQAYEKKTSYYPSYAQSMTVDHETNKLYWAGYQGRMGKGYFFEVSMDNGGLLSMTATEDNAEMTALFKPYDSGKAILPTDTEATGLSLSRAELFLTIGESAALTAMPKPYYAAMGDVTWYTSDEAVAAVSDGVVVATGVGSAVITATVGDLEVSCQVSVNNVTGGELYLYNTPSSQWVHLGAAVPQNAVGAAFYVDMGDVTAAAYLHGYIYAFDCQEGMDYNTWMTTYESTLYRIDPVTGEGDALGSTDQKITAMAFNYADGFLYGLTCAENTVTLEMEYKLLRVNPRTGETQSVQTLDSRFGAPKGGMAIDYAGNFYFVTEDPNSYCAALAKGTLEGDSLTWVSNTPMPKSLQYNTDSASLVYSAENKGLFWADEYNRIQFIDLSDPDNLQVIATGYVGGQNRRATNLGLLTVVSGEPETPVVAPTKATMPERYEMLEGDTVQVELSLEPWNASCTPTYKVADETVATVDESGVVTALSVGETTLTVTIAGLEPITATIRVEKNLGNLYGFMLYDYGDGINGFQTSSWGAIPIQKPGNGKFLSATSDIDVYAGAYYDGTIYACGQSTKDFMYYTIKLDPATYSYEVLAQTPYSVRDMAFDYTTGTMYAVLVTDGMEGGLAQLNLKTGEYTILGDMGALMVAVACDDKGVIYTLDDSGNLYTVDKVTAEATYVGKAGSSSIVYQSMHYDYTNDQLYWASASRFDANLVAIDRSNGAGRSLGRINAGGGETQSNGIQTTCLFSIPETEPQVPETVTANGVSLPKAAVAALGEDMTLEATMLPVSVTTLTDTELTWTSADESVATVKNGVVTPVATGTVIITATSKTGVSASCTVTVLDHERKFYAYDETNTQWITFDDQGNTTVVRDDKEGEAKITASVYAGDTLYSYDADGYFYSIDPVTFERTRLGDGIHGLTESLQGNEKWPPQPFYVDVPYTVVDLTWDPETGRLYATMEAFNISKYLDSFMPIIAEMDPTTGAIKEQILKNDEYRPGNLLFRDGKLYFIDGFTAGMLTSIDLNGNRTPVQYAIFAKYWGDFDGGRSFVDDTLTGTVYGIRDLRTQYYDPASGHESVLCVVGLGNASATELFEIGEGIVVNSFFIY